MSKRCRCRFLTEEVASSRLYDKDGRGPWQPRVGGCGKEPGGVSSWPICGTLYRVADHGPNKPDLSRQLEMREKRSKGRRTNPGTGNGQDTYKRRAEICTLNV